MADSDGTKGKASKKNQKRAEKRQKARVEKLKEGGIVTELLELQDPIGILRVRLQEAKLNKDHKLAAQIRNQIWIAQDSAAGCSVPDAETLGVSYDLSKVSSPNLLSEKKTNPCTLQVAASTGADTSTSELTQTEKRLRNLRKKITQIKNLKEKRDKGEQLEETQIQKVNSEDELLKEIEELEGLLSGKLKL
ncbi:uncharacterized protein LOC5514845 [Nematostella vectensis]|uniref:uncharacterized protein LOC5514845 n=1 Tax=Nematostella vectensis TaxID=45351 RepID=UPI0020777E7E|nr:uncharacterized protein LOC5514845 [Nematostella vectensis]